MNHRATKQRAVCRYYSPENNTCYYGDACQFQHPQPGGDHHFQPSAYGVSQQQPRQAPIVAPIVPPAPNRLADPTMALRNHPSAVPGAMGGRIHPPVIRGQGRGSLPIQKVNSIKTSDPRHGVVGAMHRPPSTFKMHHASNPPKRRMGAPATMGPGGMANMMIPSKPHPGMLRSPPQRKEKDPMGGGKRKDDNLKSSEESKGINGGANFRKDKEVSEEKSNGGGSESSSSIDTKGRGLGSNHGNNSDVSGEGDQEVRRSASVGTSRSRSGFAVTTLQPPPTAKSGKIKPSSSAPSTQSQVQSGGTTYFYSGKQPSYAPDFTMYPGPLAHLSSGKSPNSSSSSSVTSAQASFFVTEQVHQELQQQQLACLTVPSSDTTCPKEVDKYHNLCPLEPVDAAAPDQEVKRLFGHPSTCYRGVCQKDGLYYCLRRIHGFRLLSPKAVQELDRWKQLHHVNVVSLQEMFTTKAFGDHSVVFVYNFHPAALTLREKHSRRTKRASTLPEDLVWEYVVQLASALRLVHSRQLAVRCLDSSKVLISSRQRLRISGCGIMDVIMYDSSSSTSATPTMHQQADLYALGQLLVGVSLQSAEAGRPEHLHHSMELLANVYSPDLNHLVQYLLQSGHKAPPHSIMDVLSMIGGRLQFSLEKSLLSSDLLEQELSKELQNGRLFRVLAKLGTINERPEFAGDEQWAETGDRYLLKLLRDYLFHQVHPSGVPWINLAHVVQTLNKIDAGTYENVALHSRDEQSVLVVSFADLKQCLENSFSALLSASSNPSGPVVSDGKGINGHTH